MRTIVANWDGYLPSDQATEINRQREAVYGDPAENYRWLAERWSLIAGVKLSPMQAAMMMVDLKIMREHLGGYIIGYNDNLEDMCGFTNVLHKVKERYGKRAPAEGESEQDAAGAERVGGPELPR
jgi:hypothetical protein